jgi:hypothetical protein
LPFAILHELIRRFVLGIQQGNSMSTCLFPTAAIWAEISVAHRGGAAL